MMKKCIINGKVVLHDGIVLKNVFIDGDKIVEISNRQPTEEQIIDAIELNKVTKKYTDFKLDNISFTLPAGTIMGLVGENGAGKSTTIKLIMDSIQSDSGSINIYGKSNQSKEFTDLKQDIGIVLDEAYFPEVLNISDLNKIMKATYLKWDETLYQMYIKKFNLPLDKRIKEYSRGMKMKLAIAIALSHHPKLLVLDEATSGLDPMVRDEILDVFNDSFI